ncbi:colicin V [Legionella wadsworthii]|uniref:Colicin V n=1 Tax=Legionella wadsworthii TaxID=28088 RepID=A0A378LQG9_9GAMM|nr:CvpA family protein [Legionella wadsworthii]STY29176.1 colicin V [Legionella wadsworthii]
MNIVLNWVDFVFLIIFVLSIIFGLIRGFIRGVVSLLFLIAAVYLGLKYAPQLAEHFTNRGGSDQDISYLILIAMFLLIFIVTMAVGALVNYLLTLIFLFSELGFIDGLLGAIFGIIRAAIITIIIIYIVQLTPSANEPVWRQSKFVMYFQPITEWIVNQISPTLHDFKEKMNKTIEKIEPKNTKPTQTTPTNTTPINKTPSKTVPLKPAPTNQPPTKSVNSTGPTNMGPVNPGPANTVPANSIPENSVPNQ